MNKGDLVSVEESLLRRVYRSDKRYIDKKPEDLPLVPLPPDPKMKLSFQLTLKA